MSTNGLSPEEIAQGTAWREQDDLVYRERIPARNLPIVNKEEIAQAVTAEIISTAPPLWRSQLVNGLQIIGVLTAIVGTADFINAINALSPQAASWLTISGTALRFGVEPIVKLIGDWVDDGKRNDSFKIDP